MNSSFVGTQLSASVRAPAPQARRLVVVAEKKVKKYQEVVLTKDIQGVGKAGQIVKALNGYYRNFLKPNRMAAEVTPGILAAIEAEKKAEVERKLKIKKDAQQIATGLATIGKFQIKKKVGEDDKIFGSVTAVEIVEAIQQQTGRVLDKKEFNVPEISRLGTYEVTVRLHPEVTGKFNVVVAKDTSK